MSGDTVVVTTPDNAPAILQPTLTDAIAAARAYLDMVETVATQVDQSGQAAAASAGLAMAAAAAAQAYANTVNSRKTVADQNQVGTTSDTYVEWTSLTAKRTYALPAAASCVPGRSIILADTSGSCSTTKTITPILNGTDTFVGMSSAPYLGSAGASMVLYPTSSNSWIVR